MSRILITGRNSLIPMAAFAGISDTGAATAQNPGHESKTHRRNWHEWRLSRGEIVRGGWFVFRRGDETGRVKINPAKLPFEHSTREAAMREAGRLANANPGTEFSVFHQVETVRAAVNSEEGDAP